MFLPDDDDSKDRVKKKKKASQETDERSLTNGKKKKVPERQREVIAPSESNNQLIDETSVDNERINKQLSHEKKPKGVSALKAKKSGVVGIKRVKRKGRHESGVSDVIADISCQLDVGTGIGSSW